MPIWYGGDYNPEQWTPEVWNDDVRLMQDGGINLATVGVFSWAKLEPREGEFDFDWLDAVLDKLHAAGIRVDLATATASPPPWLTHTYPEVLPVTEDGTRLYPGSRQQYCPSSPVYRWLAHRLVRKLAARYANHPALELWHINNEYGCHVSHCYCDVSAAAFRRWLQQKYGTIAALNEAWGTAFWSQSYSSFAEVYPPRSAPTFRNPTQLLDFDRFSSNELLDLFLAERAVLEELSPGTPITTNFMGFFKPVDYWKWAPHVDIVADDAYPDPVDPGSAARAAMTRDLMRSLRGGQPWMLMEQAPSAVNWRSFNAAKPAGMQRAWSYQCIARGADGVLFFQWRQSVAGAEKFHSGMVPHAGTDTRVWREVKQLGNELAGLERVVGSRVESQAAIMFDWDSWRALEQSASPAHLSYVDGIAAWHRAFYDRSVTVDFVSPEHDLSAYSLVVVPSLFTATHATRDRLDAYVRSGGTLVVTFQSLITDQNLHITPGGYLGVAQDTLGVWIEEFAPRTTAGSAGESLPGSVALSGGAFAEGARGLIWAEYVHARGAEVLARFADGDVAGWPAVTRNRLESGSAWYVATMPDPSSMSSLLEDVLADAGIEPPQDTAPGIERVQRGDLVFRINHGTEPVTVILEGADLLSGAEAGELVLAPRAVAISEHARVVSAV